MIPPERYEVDAYDNSARVVSSGLDEAIIIAQLCAQNSGRDSYVRRHASRELVATIKPNGRVEWEEDTFEEVVGLVFLAGMIVLGFGVTLFSCAP